MKSSQHSILNGLSPAASLRGCGLDFIKQAIWLPYSIKPKGINAKGNAMLRIGTTGKSGVLQKFKRKRHYLYLSGDETKFHRDSDI